MAASTARTVSPGLFSGIFGTVLVCRRSDSVIVSAGLDTGTFGSEALDIEVSASAMATLTWSKSKVARQRKM